MMMMTMMMVVVVVVVVAVVFSSVLRGTPVTATTSPEYPLRVGETVGLWPWIILVSSLLVEGWKPRL